MRSEKVPPSRLASGGDYAESGGSPSSGITAATFDRYVGHGSRRRIDPSHRRLVPLRGKFLLYRDIIKNKKSPQHPGERQSLLDGGHAQAWNRARTHSRRQSRVAHRGQIETIESADSQPLSQRRRDG